MLAADTSSATYGLQGSDVEVRLSTDTRMGGAHWEAARFIARARPIGSGRTSSTPKTLQDRIGSLAHEAGKLRRSLAKGDERTKELAAKMDAMTDAMTRRHP